MLRLHTSVRRYALRRRCSVRISVYDVGATLTACAADCLVPLTGSFFHSTRYANFEALSLTVQFCPLYLSSTLNSGICGMMLPPCESLKSGVAGMSNVRCLRQTHKGRHSTTDTAHGDQYVAFQNAVNLLLNCSKKPNSFER